MAKSNLNTVKEILKYEEDEGFSTFEKNRKHIKFDDEIKHKRNKKRKKHEDTHSRRYTW